MKEFLLMMRLDISSSLRSKWFIGYSLVFILMVTLLFSTNITESRVIGFTGLTRGLLVFIQACNIIMPVFILVTTVRTISSDRESNVLEYMLSFPVSLKSYYWGKFLGRFIVIFLPLIFALLLSTVISIIASGDVEFTIIFLYSGLLGFNALAFLGIAFFISSIIKGQEFAMGLILLIWLTLIAFIDIALIGFMIKNALPETMIYVIALLNPVQVFRISAISLFDPALSVIGPSSFFILDTFGKGGLIAYSLIYPTFIGLIFSVVGYRVFKKRDLV